MRCGIIPFSMDAKNGKMFNVQFSIVIRSLTGFLPPSDENWELNIFPFPIRATSEGTPSSKY